MHPQDRKTLQQQLAGQARAASVAETTSAAGVVLMVQVFSCINKRRNWTTSAATAALAHGPRNDVWCTTLHTWATSAAGAALVDQVVISCMQIV